MPEATGRSLGERGRGRPGPQDKGSAKSEGGEWARRGRAANPTGRAKSGWRRRSLPPAKALRFVGNVLVHRRKRSRGRGGGVSLRAARLRRPPAKGPLSNTSGFSSVSLFTSASERTFALAASWARRAKPMPSQGGGGVVVARRLQAQHTQKKKEGGTRCPPSWAKKREAGMRCAEQPRARERYAVHAHALEEPALAAVPSLQGRRGLGCRLLCGFPWCARSSGD